MKRWLSLLLIIMQIPFFACSKAFAYGENEASSANTAKHIKALTALGIIDELDQKAFSSDEPITRADFVSIVASVMNCKNTDTDKTKSVYYRDISEKSDIAGEVDYLTSLGYFSGMGDGLFCPDEPVQMIHMMTVMAKVLGYGIIAEHDGGYPSGYIKSLKTAGVKFDLKSSDEWATGARAAELIYQSLDAEMCMMDANGEIYREDSVNLLSEYHDIEIGEGLADDVDYDDLSKEGRMSINEVTYYYMSRDIEQWLGKYVKYFYDRYDHIIYLEEDAKNKIIDVDESLLKEIKNGKLYYYADEALRRTVSKNISPSADYYYNGVRVIPEIREDMSKYLPKYDGSVRLIDNNNDGAAEFIIIMDYDTFVVNDANVKECIYYDKYTQRLNESGQAEMQKPLDLSDDAVRFAHITDARTGVFLERSDIIKGNVLSVAKSLDGTIVHIIVSDDSVTGTVSSASTDDNGRAVVTIDGKEYIAAKAYSDFRGKILIGTTATFKLTGSGIIADFDMSSSYVYLIDAMAYEEDGDKETLFKVYTPEGKLEKIKGEKKITINQHKNVTYDNIISVLKNGGAEVESGIVMIEKSSSGKVKKLYTKDANSESDKRIYKRSCFSTSADYDSNLSVFYTSDVGELVNQVTKNIGGKIAFNDETLLFDIPDSPKTADEKEFGVSSMSSYPHFTYIRDIETYGSDEDKLAADVIVRNATGEVNIVENQVAVLISRIYDMVDEVGEIVVGVDGYQNGKAVSYVADDMDNLIAQRLSGGLPVQLGVGDVARFTFSVNGRIKGSEIMIDASSEENSRIMQSSGDLPDTGQRFNHGFRLQKAKVYRIEQENLVISNSDVIQAEAGAMLPSNYEIMPIDSRTHCWTVDFSRKKKIEEFNIRELKDYVSYGEQCDEVYIYQRECAYDIIIYKQ